MKEIQLTKGFVTLVDDEDYERFHHLPWYYLSPPKGRACIGYVARKSHAEKRQIFLHNEVLDIIPSRQRKDGCVYSVDHIDRNPLNNLRSNLRFITFSANVQNRATPSNNASGYRGVSFDKHRGIWKVSLAMKGRPRYFGRFKNIENAARAYDKVAREYYGPLAATNFP